MPSADGVGREVLRRAEPGDVVVEDLLLPGELALPPASASTSSYELCVVRIDSAICAAPIASAPTTATIAVDELRPAPARRRLDGAQPPAPGDVAGDRGAARRLRCAALMRPPSRARRRAAAPGVARGLRARSSSEASSAPLTSSRKRAACSGSSTGKPGGRRGCRGLGQRALDDPVLERLVRQHDDAAADRQDAERGGDRALEHRRARRSPRCAAPGTPAWPGARCAARRTGSRRRGSRRAGPTARSAPSRRAAMMARA